MFRRTQSQPEQAQPAAEASAPTSGGKGRPTPKRSESEAARRQKMAPPKDKREARSRMKAERARERQLTMDALKAGDERHYPARDQGKARHIARNWVDGRRNVGEFFWPVVIAALVMLFLPVPVIQQTSTTVLLAFYLLITADTAWSLLGLRRALSREVPEKYQRSGSLPYAFGRSIQSRKRRMPPPKVDRGWTRRFTRGEVDAVVH